MKVLMLSNPYDNIFNQIEIAKKLNFDGIEIVLERETKKMFLEGKLEILKNERFIYTFHLDNNYNIFDKKDFKELKDICRNIDSIAVLHLNCKKDLFESFIKKVKKLKCQNIVVENLDHSIEEINYFLEISDLNLAFDISHAFSFNNKSKVFEFIEKSEKRIKHFHLSDCKFFEHSHLPLGNGILPLKDIAKILKKVSKTVTLELIETEIPEIDYSVSLNILRSL